MVKKLVVNLGFDVEEFDVPDEFGFPIPFDEQVRYSKEGTIALLDLLSVEGIKATFYCTVQFAQAAPYVVKRIVEEGHELASHGVYHSRFDEKDLLASRLALESQSGSVVRGYRMPRMMPVSSKAILAAGYVYNSSLHPTWIPGRYNNLKEPRTIFRKDNLVEYPASVSPWFRIPLFWISLHVMPMWIYLWLCRRTLKSDGYVNLYYHPWEFVNLKTDQFTLPWYITRLSGKPLLSRLSKLIRNLKKMDAEFETSSYLVEKTFPTPAAVKN